MIERKSWAEGHSVCGLKISLSLSEGKFVAISPTQGKRLCLRQKFVLGLEKRHEREIARGRNGHGQSP